MTIEIDYYLFNELMLNKGLVQTPSEWHGWVCGRLCGGSDLDQAAWLKASAEYLDDETLHGDDPLAVAFSSLLKSSETGLDDAQFGFTLLLPDDQHSELPRRARELACWCREFLVGLTLSRLRGESSLSPESAELLRDFAQISQLELDPEQALEEQEADLMELLEFVKIGALNLRLELAEDEAKAQPVSKHELH